MARLSSTARGYDRHWRKARDAFLAASPLCVMCAADGVTAAASVVDHIIPHGGDHGLFWDRSNWQPLCTTHHSATKQRAERAGWRGCQADGWA